MVVVTTADWFIAIGTLVLAVGTLALAVVAVFQDAIRARLRHPTLRASIVTSPPDCVAVPIRRGNLEANSVYLRLLVENVGNTAAKNAEVYAKGLKRRCADGTWESVRAFPPMNLKWAHLGTIYFAAIGPSMSKHCDMAHVIDPSLRYFFGEDNEDLGLTEAQASMTFDLMVAPNHKGHIVGPGDYRLEIVLAAENAAPKIATIAVSFSGTWYEDEIGMLRDGIGASVLAQEK